MIKILHTLMEAANSGLADAVRKEAEKVLGILSEAYGNADGGYVAVCDNFQDAQQHLKSRHAENLLPEWTKSIDPRHEAALYLLGDDYSLVLIYRKEC